MSQLDVLNPVAIPVSQHYAPAARAADLSGKTLGLYWNLKTGGQDGLRHAAHLLERRYPGMRVREYVGAVGMLMRHATAEQADQIAQECDVVIGATAD